MEETILNKNFSKIINEKLKKKETEEEKDTAEKANNQTKSFSSDTKTSTQTNSNTENSEDLKKLSANEALEKVAEIAQNYRVSDTVDAPDSLGLEKIDVPNKTQEEIENLAKSQVESQYNTSKGKSNQSFQNKIDDIIQSNQSIIEKNQENKDQINSYYDNSVKETENQALKRGLARSSIVIGELASIEGSRANELSKLLTSYQSALDENQKKIQDYEVQKQQAIDNLDIQQALAIEEKISSLTEEYNKARKEAITFNNNVEKLEAEYKLDLDKRKQEKEQTALKIDKTYGTDYIEQEIQQKQYDFLEQYFDSLEPNYALNLLLTNKNFKTVLKSNYSKLYQHIAKKV